MSHLYVVVEEVCTKDGGQLIITQKKILNIDLRSWSTFILKVSGSIFLMSI